MGFHKNAFLHLIEKQTFGKNMQIFAKFFVFLVKNYFFPENREFRGIFCGNPP